MFSKMAIILAEDLYFRFLDLLAISLTPHLKEMQPDQ